MKEEKATVRDLIKTDICNMADGEFNVIIIRIPAGLEKSIEDTRESLTGDI